MFVTFCITLIVCRIVLLGGSCVTTDDSYSCECRAGFAGDNCEININDCEVNPCFNSGTCIDEVNSFRCLCVPGFLGDLCQDNVDDCLTHPCANGGTCLDLINDFQCRCPPGYTGKDCSINVNECQPNPCLNGGTCVDGVEEYVCKCLPNYSGQRCEQPLGTVIESINLIAYESNLNNSTHLPMTVLSGERAEPLSSKQLIIIGFVSASVPLIALIAAIVIMVCKHRRHRDDKIRRREEDDIRRQNEQNLVTSCINTMNNKCTLDSHGLPAANVIVNALDRPPSVTHLNRKSATLSKLTNHEIYDSKQNIYSNRMSINEKSATLQSLKKTKSNNKLINTECTSVNNSKPEHRPASKLMVDVADPLVSQSPDPSKQDCVANNGNVHRRGSLTPPSVPNPLAKR